MTTITTKLQKKRQQSNEKLQNETDEETEIRAIGQRNLMVLKLVVKIDCLHVLLLLKTF